MEWRREPESGDWVAEDEIAPHFSVQYAVSGDETNHWGSYVQYWRERGSEPDQVDMDELYSLRELDSVESMKHAVEQYHVSTVRPQLEEFFRKYQTEEGIQTE